MTDKTKKIPFSSIMLTSNNLHNYESVGADLFGNRKNEVVVSIMIPTYKRPSLLRKAIESALNQRTDTKYEVVVIDNDNETSDDAINQLLNIFGDERVSYYRNHQNIGMFGNWNRCINYAKGEWLIILNDDDELTEMYVDRMMLYVRQHKNCGAIACQHWFIDNDESIIGGDLIAQKIQKMIRIKLKDFYFFHPINIFGCLIHRKLAVDIGGFDESLYPCSDAAFLLNVCRLSNLYLVTDYLFRYRWAVNESMKNETQIKFAEFNLIKSYQLNQKYHFYMEAIDKYFRNCMCDNLTYLLKKKMAITENNIGEFRTKVHCSKKYNSVRRFMGRVINRVYRYYFKKRKRESILIIGR